MVQITFHIVIVRPTRFSFIASKQIRFPEFHNNNQKTSAVDVIHITNRVHMFRFDLYYIWIAYIIYTYFSSEKQHNRTVLNIIMFVFVFVFVFVYDYMIFDYRMKGPNMDWENRPNTEKCYTFMAKATQLYESV